MLKWSVKNFITIAFFISQLRRHVSCLPVMNSKLSCPWFKSASLIGYVYIITEGNSSRRSTNEIDTNNMATTEKENNRIFQPKCLINGFVTILTRRVPLVEQELLILPEHLSSLPVYSRVRVTRSLVLCVCFVDHCLSFCPFSFCLCVFCPSICKFWLHLWYLQTLLAYHWHTPVTKPKNSF